MVRQDNYQVILSYDFHWGLDSPSFLRPAARLAYKDAQDVIEGKVLGGVPVVPEHDAADIAHDIRVLGGLAKRLREQRFENGCLSLGLPRLSFKLGNNGLPEDCEQSEHSDAEELVEEVYFCSSLACTTAHILVCSLWCSATLL
jgi:protein SSD1